MSASERYQAGDLRGAIAEALEDVRRHPADPDRRGLLCELLCIGGDLERADKQLDALGHQSPEAMIGVALFRQLIRADQARREFFDQGRLPEFLDPPPPWLRLHLEASIDLRQGEPAAAADKLTRAEDGRPKLAGNCDERPFDDLRDLDDLTAGVFEVLTSNGKYYWIPCDRVELVEFRPPGRPRDLLWRRARMVVRGGPDGEVFLPAIYGGVPADDDRARLGRVTEWAGGDGAPTRGVGQRTYLIGDDARPILEIGSIAFADAG